MSASRIAFWSIGLGAVGVGIISSMYNVKGGHRAVIYSRLEGVSQEVVGEGIHFLVPWLQQPIIFDVRPRPRRIETVTGSKDMQMVHISLLVQHKPEVDKLPQIFQRYGPNYDDLILPAIGKEILKSVVAQFYANELVTQRDLVSLKIREDLGTRAKHFNILLDDISIVDLTFGSEFPQAVE